MSSKEKILAAVLENQPQVSPLPDIGMFKGEDQDIVQKYCDIFTGIGGKVFLVDDIAKFKNPEIL